MIVKYIIIDFLKYIKKVSTYMSSFMYKSKFKNVKFKLGSYIDENTFFEGYNSVSYNTKIYKSSINRGTYIGENCKFSKVKIGRFCSIGSRIVNISGSHPIDTFVSTHPAFFSDQKQSGFTFSEKSTFKELKFVDKSDFHVKIGNDVWIGDNVIILDGIVIGDGAIIGTGSIVTKNVESYSVNVGIPAKTIKYRFAKDEINFLLKDKWWNNDMEWLNKNVALFQNLNDYIKFKTNK